MDDQLVCLETDYGDIEASLVPALERRGDFCVTKAVRSNYNNNIVLSDELYVITHAPSGLRASRLLYTESQARSLLHLLPENPLGFPMCIARDMDEYFWIGTEMRVASDSIVVRDIIKAFDEEVSNETN